MAHFDFAGLGVFGAFLVHWLVLLGLSHIPAADVSWYTERPGALALSALDCCVILVQTLHLKLLSPSSALWKIEIILWVNYFLLWKVTQKYCTYVHGFHLGLTTDGLWATPSTQLMCADLVATWKGSQNLSLLGMWHLGPCCLLSRPSPKEGKNFPAFQLDKETSQEQHKNYLNHLRRFMKQGGKLLSNLRPRVSKSGGSRQNLRFSRLVCGKEQQIK